MAVPGSLTPRWRPRRTALLSLTAAVAVVAGLVAASPSALAASWAQSASDPFDRSVTGGLGSAPLGGSYATFPAAATSLFSVADGSAVISELPPGSAAGAFLPSVVSADTTVKSAVLVPAPRAGSDLYFALEARKQGDGSAYRGRIKVSGTGQLALSFSRTAGSDETALGKIDLPFGAAAGQKINLQFEVTGTDPVQLRSRAWLDGAAEPGWQYELTDSAAGRLAGSGTVGFWSYASSAGAPISYQIPTFIAGAQQSVAAAPVPTTAAPAPTTAAPAPTTAAPAPTTAAPAPTTAAPAPSVPAAIAPAAVSSTKPNASNTGVPAGTTLTRYTGPTTITVDGTVIDSKAIYSDLKIAAKNVIIRNSYLHCGTGNPPGNTGCIDANSGNVYNLLVEKNTIIPDKPSYYRDGIVGHEFTARRNHIKGTNDGIGIFNKPGGSVLANVTVESNYIHDLTHWNKDPAHSDGTHNDGIQIQGGQNIFIRSNTVVGSVVAGDGLGPYGKHGGAALIVGQNVSPIANLIIEKNWFDDGQNSVCINHGSRASITLTLQNNFFGRNQYDFGGGSKYAIRVYSKSKSAIAGLWTNRWEDTNVLMTEGKSNGIRFNAA